MTGLIIGLLITMVFSAFFSGMEIAFVSSNRLLAEMDREKNGLSQRAIGVFYRHPNNFVSTMLVGNNISLVIYGILFADIFDQTLFSSLSDATRVTADKLLSTLVVLFTGEFLPKTILKSRQEVRSPQPPMHQLEGTSHLQEHPPSTAKQTKMPHRLK